MDIDLPGTRRLRRVTDAHRYLLIQVAQPRDLAFQSLKASLHLARLLVELNDVVRGCEKACQYVALK